MKKIMKEGAKMPANPELELGQNTSLKQEYFQTLSRIRPGQDTPHYLDPEVSDVSRARMKLLLKLKQDQPW